MSAYAGAIRRGASAAPARELLGEQLQVGLAPSCEPNESQVNATPKSSKLATGEGWLYLPGIKDVFTCELVSYAMDERMTQTLTALWKAVRNKRPAPGLIHHSDCGSQRAVLGHAGTTWLCLQYESQGILSLNVLPELENGAILAASNFK